MVVAMASDVRLSNRSSMVEDMHGANSNERPIHVQREVASYDVFISHRGPDTKTGFVSFLEKEMVAVGLRTFLDCKSINYGEDSWECIEHAIKKTSIAVVVFSESFAQSEWCLRELHVMLHTPTVTVLPVFYRVKPCEVRFPEGGQLKDGFEKLCGRHPEEVIDQWREDLGQASKLMGWEHFGVVGRLEGDLVKAIVEKALELANKPLLIDVGEHVVGIEEAAVEIVQVLEEKEKVLMLGLWGMGGIGKSTLARELYNRMRNKFGASCFIEDVQAKVGQGGMERVQNQILRELCKNESMKIENMSMGRSLLEERLSNMKFLLVLDNVDEDVNMYYCLSRRMLGIDSKCIVTSRDACVIRSLGEIDVNNEIHIHEVKGLNEVDSQRVFASFAFGGYSSIKEGFAELVAHACRACHGVPLVLKVFGALLRDVDDVEIWKEVVKKLECGMIMDERNGIFECLQISYNRLEETVKEMFLDIACVMLGESKDCAVRVWKSRGYCAFLGIKRLVEKALITIDLEGCFNMHDHLRDMGRKIVKMDMMRSGVIKRLWMPESFNLIKEKEELFKSLQCLMIDTNDGPLELDVSHAKDLQVFICHSVVNLGLSIPRNLRWFVGSIDGHLKFLPNNKLCILNLQSSRVKTMCTSIVHATELEVLDMSNCTQLNSLPSSFGMLSSLEVLNMEWCYKLTSLPCSFGSLKKLRHINFERSRIQSLPESFGELSSLEKLNVRGCEELTSLPCSFGSLKKLRVINFEQSGIQSLPESFGELSSLEVLNMRGCKELTSLPCSFGSLKKLWIINFEWSGIQSLPESFVELSSLKVLNMRGCEELTSLPCSFGSLEKLRNIYFERSGIQSLPESFVELSSLEVLNMRGCEKLTSLPYSFGSLKKLRYINLKWSGIQSLPESVVELSSLEVLNMEWCFKLSSLPCSFGSLKKLRDINFEHSRIQSLPESFVELSGLEVLNMKRCYKLTSLPCSFGSLKMLRDINFERSGIQSLPESFVELSSLEVLNMRGCEELTSLPCSFGSLKKLRYINFEESGIQSLPESFGELSSLEVLNMRGCEELTSLPCSFGSLKMLRDINFERSGIQSLPESFAELSSLKVLNMRGCEELTSLPCSFGSLKKLEDINFEWSGIQSLPESFVELSSLEVLNMRGCEELTSLPCSFGSLKKLRDINFEHSGIQSLPESFVELSSLEVLNMRGCEELTSLPCSFGSLKKLRDINFEHSGIQSLPESFG